MGQHANNGMVFPVFPSLSHDSKTRREAFPILEVTIDKYFLWSSVNLSGSTPPINHHGCLKKKVPSNWIHYLVVTFPIRLYYISMGQNWIPLRLDDYKKCTESAPHFDP